MVVRCFWCFLIFIFLVFLSIGSLIMAWSQTLPIFHIPQYLSIGNHLGILHSLLLDIEKKKKWNTLKLFLMVLMSSVYCFRMRNSSVFKCRITRRVLFSKTQYNFSHVKGAISWNWQISSYCSFLCGKVKFTYEIPSSNPCLRLAFCVACFLFLSKSCLKDFAGFRN